MAQRYFPSLDILIVTWNGLSVLKKCVEAVRRHTSHSYRLLVWNNGSTDGTKQWLRKQRDILAFHSKRNIGISKGFNRLLHHVNSTVALRLDDDAIVPRGWIEKLLPPLEDKRVAIVGCKFVNPKGHLKATEFIPPLFPPPLSPDGPEWQYTRTVEAVGGPCFAFRTADVKRAGGYWEKLSDFHEDTDLCLRLRLSGKKIVCIASLPVTNYALNRRRPGTVPRNRRLFWKKWASFKGFPRPDSHEIDRRTLRGWRYYISGRFQKAIRELRPLCGTSPRECGSQFILGLAYRGQGNLSMARKAIRKLVRHHSRSALLAEASWALQEECYDEAKRALREGIRLFPEEARFWFLLGQLEERRGEKRAARENFLKAVRKLPSKTIPDPAPGQLFYDMPHIP